MEQLKKECLSEDTWKLIQERKKINAKLTKTTNIENKVALRKEYEQLKKQVKKAARKDKRNWMEDIAQRAEEAATTNNTRELYKISNLLINKKYNNGKLLYNKEGKLLMVTEEQVKR
ncbi:hypothetical protein Zmor_001234 [Zophobas morio]|uniref:Uncharacterized protein n=1 Tax=Zophobas morio TaxID=2755281 RepID=A0AA38J4X7_9CUCU|nr:hypothetical protein Zmor_001234 [Zophobas morio]